MTARIVITCDVPGCDLDVTTGSNTAWVGRLQAGDHGWNANEHGDYCPIHAREEDR